MKIQGLVVGKRVTVGMALAQLAAIGAHYFPAHAAPLVSAAGVLTFVVQVWIANNMSITSK